MKIREIKEKFTEITELKAIAANGRKYLKVKKDFRRKDTWQFIIDSIVEEEFIKLSEIIKCAEDNNSKFKKKIKSFCEELIGTVSCKGMNYNDHIDFIFLTGLYVNDINVIPADGRKVFFSSSKSLQFKNYKNQVGQEWLDSITTVIAAFPPVSSQKEARDNALKLFKNIRHTDFNNLCPRLIAFYNRFKGEVWDSMQDYLKWNKETGYNVPTSAKEVETIFSFSFGGWWDDGSDTDAYDDVKEGYCDYRFKQLKSDLKNHTIEELSIFIHECFNVPQESCLELVTKYNRWVANEPKRRHRREEEERKKERYREQRRQKEEQERREQEERERQYNSYNYDNYNYNNYSYGYNSASSYSPQMAEVQRVFISCRDAQELKRAYYKYSKKYHPDQGGSTELMQELNELYEESKLAFKTVEEEFAYAYADADQPW